MLPKISRRRFVGNAAVVSLGSLIPPLVRAATGLTRNITVLADQEVGTVRPEFHGHFAEHLGSCVYGGLWVGKNSPIPNIDCRFRWSTQHLLGVYSPESGILGFFWDVDSSAARPGRAALERWGPSRFLAGSIAAGADSYFRSSHAARGFADRRSKPAHRWLP